MRIVYILLAAVAASTESQTGWSRPNAGGISYLTSGDIDRTEGIGAFMDLTFESGTRNFDIGGGSFDLITFYLASLGVTNYVYDPFARSSKHNREVLKSVLADPVDTVTSMSVLNVIDDPTARFRHISLCKKSLKPGGKALFRVWPGDHSGKGAYIPGGFQSNRDARSYLPEISHVFGAPNVEYDPELDVVFAKIPIV